MSEAEQPSVDTDMLYGPDPTAEVEQVSEPEESAPSPEPTQAKTEPEAKVEPEQSDEAETDDGDLPKGAQKYIARQKFKAEQAKREAEEARRKAQELEEKLAKYEAKPEPTIPDVPDPLDDDFAERLRAREAAIAEKERWEAEQRQLQAERQRMAQERQHAEEQRRLQEAREREQSYVKRIESSGLAPEQVEQALAKVVQDHENYLPEPLRVALVEDSDSPLIAKYLADNPDAGYAMHGMSQYQATQYLLSEIKPKALQLKPKPSKAPEPPEHLDGGGTSEIDVFREYGGQTLY